jgi:hypothetical protein
MLRRLTLALALLAFAAPLAAAAPVPLSAEMNGQNEVSNGDIIAAGQAKLTIDVDSHTVTWTITTKNLTDPIAAHIHQGAPGSNGPVVVNFGKDLSGTTSDAKPEMLQAILANPGDYYVNVHTKVAQSGAIRGQLKK